MVEGVTTGGSKIDLINAKFNPSQAETDQASLADDFDEFLLLLTTQLKNQDPTEPMDTEAFTTQLVQFAGVEQQIKANDNLEALVTYEQSQQLDSAVGYLGTLVDADGKAGMLQDGYAGFAYELSADAYKTTVVITDGAGRAVYSGQGPTEAGTNRVVWDGVNSYNGTDSPEGIYYISVVARNAREEIVESKTFTSGYVTGARTLDGKVYVEVAGTDIPVEEITSVRTPSYVDLDETPGADDPDDKPVTDKKDQADKTADDDESDA